MSAALLEVGNVTAGYGNIPVLHGVNLDVAQGEIVTLIGANGAGKTTLMMTIFGRPRATYGRIRFDGRDITNLPTHSIARLRIAQSPEGRRIFPRLTVLENLQMGALIANDPGGFERDLERVCALFPVLKQRKLQRGGTLSGGEQQMLAIARALMGRPKLLLLDEPSLGLAPLIVKQIFETIRDLNGHDLTVFLVEQNAYHALKLAHRGYVMVNGRITMTGTGRDLLESEEVKAAYLEGGAYGAGQGQKMSWLSDDSFGVFLVLTVIIGGGAAFHSGKSLARSWKPFWRVFVYMALLAAAIRFFHYALFDGSLLSPYYYLITYAVLLAAACLGFQMMRTTQMVTQYRWLYQRTSPLTWRDRRA